MKKLEKALKHEKAKHEKDKMKHHHHHLHQSAEQPAQNKTALLEDNRKLMQKVNEFLIEKNDFIAKADSLEKTLSEVTHFNPSQANQTTLAAPKNETAQAAAAAAPANETTPAYAKAEQEVEQLLKAESHKLAAAEPLEKNNYTNTAQAYDEPARNATAFAEPAPAEPKTPIQSFSQVSRRKPKHHAQKKTG